MTSPQSSYLFTSTQDWFSFNEETWRELFKHVTAPHPRVLEIGSWEGRSAVFLLTELCGEDGELVSIDHFDLMETEAGRERYRKLTHNLSLAGKRFRILDSFSVPALMALLTEEMSSENPGFDWIYVDGSHEADDTLLDGELAWRLARKGAVVVFDDYHWNREPEDSIHHPKRGIDAFLALHAGEYTILSSETQYQKIVQKKTDMRIGFLVKDKAAPIGRLESALGYGISVALTIDAEYAMPAAVAIRSVASTTRGRITFYVAGRGLSKDLKAKLSQAIVDQTNQTIVFIDLPPPSSTTSGDGAVPDGMTWGKIAMIPFLPVERVIYLDADVLACGDIQELWDTDLEGKPIAAAPDVGLPTGHDSEGVTSIQYFNAGVLVMDLAAIRQRLPQLYAVAEKTKDSKHQDQDALNVHFKDNWRRLSLRWNAQGLGTYARYYMPERMALGLEEMEDPAIVHFTGALHPSVADVLNPFVQPYGGKPWGYAGAPGHPYAEEWWRICEDTAWKGWRTSTEYKAQCTQKMDVALAAGVEAFRRKIGEVLQGN
ncbi:glycosyl transferase [Earliella scabrosa]|nr:glycosyl transferase [Earliella scabrosa]